jgi:opacity protein-like surface antigen
MDPRNPTQPRINPRQDPQDPLQQRPRVNPQDTDPRPLPNNLIDPTELPIPPRDRNVRPGDQGNGVDPPFDPSSQERNPFIYPNEAYPGQQSYPGPTSAYERSQPQGQPTPTDTSQVLYPPREQGMMGQQPYPPMQMRNPYPNFDAATGLPVQQGMPQTTFDQPAMLGEYQQVIEPGYGSSVACGEPDGWRPQLAIGENSCADTCYDPCCFEPLFYLAAFGGFSDLDDLDGGVPGVGNLSAGFNMDNGSSFGLALGQFQGANLRTELEYAFRYNDMDSLQLTDNQGAGLNLSSFNLDGNVTAHSGMANVIWQFQTAGSRWVNPYVGGGVGFVFLSAEADRVGRSVLADGADGNSSFAYQLFAGINTQLSSTMDVFVEYRHFGADKIRLQTDLVAANAGTGVFAGSYDYSSDNVHFGLRFKF